MHFQKINYVNHLSLNTKKSFDCSCNLSYRTSIKDKSKLKIKEKMEK